MSFHSVYLLLAHIQTLKGGTCLWFLLSEILYDIEDELIKAVDMS